jgi:hypothetical protein
MNAHAIVVLLVAACGLGVVLRPLAKLGLVLYGRKDQPTTDGPATAKDSEKAE